MVYLWKTTYTSERNSESESAPTLYSTMDSGFLYRLQINASPVEGPLEQIEKKV